MSKKKIWLLKGPLTQYNEDVKQLAEKAGLRIIDARYAVGVEGEKKTPKVTAKGAKKKAPKAKKLPEAQEEPKEA